MLIMKIESHPCYSINLWFIQMGIYGGLKNMLRKIQMADSKKLSFSATTNSQYFFTKISGIGPWVSRLNWYDEHWFCSTYMVVRLSEASSIYCKKTLKCIFSSKLSLHRTAWWPQFFLSRPFWFFFQNKLFFAPFLLGYGWDSIFMITMISIKIRGAIDLWKTLYDILCKQCK